MSGEWKRGMVSYSGTGNRKGRPTRKASPTPPRHSSTLPLTAGVTLTYGGSAAISLVLYGALGFFLWRFALLRRFRKIARTECEPPGERHGLQRRA